MIGAQLAGGELIPDLLELAGCDVVHGLLVRLENRRAGAKRACRGSNVGYALAPDLPGRAWVAMCPTETKAHWLGPVAKLWRRILGDRCSRFWFVMSAVVWVASIACGELLVAEVVLLFVCVPTLLH